MNDPYEWPIFILIEDAPLCLQNSLEKWYEKMEKADAVIKHIPSDSVDHEFLPFVGEAFYVYM